MDTIQNPNLVQELHKQMYEMFKKEHSDNNLRIGDAAPNFTAMTTYGPLKMSDCKGKWVIFFSHPGDFTPVCTTEFLSFANLFPEFSKRNTQLIGLSIDSNSSHLAWVNNIYRSTGINIPFPIVADRDMQISKMYGMIAPNTDSTKTVRNVYFIDPNQKIRAIISYPLTNGRNIYEILRLLDALQLSDLENVATPANWLPGQPVIVPPPQTYPELMERMKNPIGNSCMDWYLCYKNMKVPEFKNMCSNDNSQLQHQHMEQNIPSQFSGCIRDEAKEAEDK